jgi:polysaccharide pyruvyl transferase WcaK-like protein
MALYRAADVVVTQHLHSFIFAPMVGTPGLVMSVDGHKVERLVDELGLPEWMVIDAATDGSATVLERVWRRGRPGRRYRQTCGGPARRRAHPCWGSLANWPGLHCSGPGEAPG